VNIRILNSCILSSLLLGVPSWAAADVVVILNPQNPNAALTKSDISDIFLGKSTEFPGGGPATPIEHAESAPIRAEFHASVTGKSSGQLKAYWAKVVFTGKGQPPKEGLNSQDIKKIVASDPTAIGYIEKGALDTSVKAVLSAP
jgi:ABC-type phosphate transport system substrate-binding protein